ncbi:hypothetical protein ACA910_000850 [Epithemia clementina (nom. ined.)]
MNCGPSQQTLDDEAPRPMLRDRSEFGDNRSLGESHSNSLNNGNSSRFPMSSQYHDEPEADYDNGATGLYRCIEGKDWDGALSRLELAPIEAKTWVSRRESGKEKVRWRLLPLHAVCIFRAPLALIEALIEVYADGPKMKDDQGMLPVHLACRNGASKGVVLTLLSAFPDSINIRDRKNRLPVDLVEASNSQNKETVLSALKKFQRDMLKMNYVPPQQEVPAIQTLPSSHSLQPSIHPVLAAAGPGALGNVDQKELVNVVGNQTMVKEVDYEHRTVLFRMILKKDWKQAAARARTFPGEAATWIVTKGFNGNLRFLPLHKACVLQPPSSIIESLLEAFPEGAESKDQDGWLPIHCACFYGADADVVNHLLTTYARGANQKDEEGRLPLHYACLKGASQEVVDVLLATSSKSAMAKDDEGRQPIHHACGKGAPESVIDALLKAAPKGAQSKDDQGRLPLHHACRKNTSERVIRTLLRVYPRAAQIKDDQDKLAIHYACQHGASPAIVHLLLTTNPESINVKNGFGHTPIAEVKAANNPKMEPVLKVLEKFKESHDQNVLLADTTDAEGKIQVLQDKVTSLERTLSRIGEVGRDIKAELRRGRDPEEVLEDLADRLLLIGKASATSRTTTPLKTKQGTPTRISSNRSTSSSAGRSGRVSTGKKRHSTPSRGLFGRKKVNS